MKKLYQALSFDDVLLVDKFSEIRSRGDKDVDTSVSLMGTKLTTPVISSNMMCVTNPTLANAMVENGGYACLPRFMTIEQNIEEYKQAKVMVSIGLGIKEIERAKALYDLGANQFLIDVAHGANIAVVEQMKALRDIVKNNASIAVGNFSNLYSFDTFKHKVQSRIDAVKIGIGGGAACITRKVTGCGMPTFASIIDMAECGYPIIADGGIRDSGDMNKALAAGATAVMCGRLFVGCDESPAEKLRKVKMSDGSAIVHKPDRIEWNDEELLADVAALKVYQEGHIIPQEVFYLKKYSGSASAESYEAQGKTASFRAPEGETYWVPVCGPVVGVIEALNGGLRSCLGYNNAKNIRELKDKAYFIQVTENAAKENGAHGKLTNV